MTPQEVPPTCCWLMVGRSAMFKTQSGIPHTLLSKRLFRVQVKLISSRCSSKEHPQVDPKPPQRSHRKTYAPAAIKTQVWDVQKKKNNKARKSRVWSYSMFLFFSKTCFFLKKKNVSYLLYFFWIMYFSSRGNVLHQEQSGPEHEKVKSVELHLQSSSSCHEKCLWHHQTAKMATVTIQSVPAAFCSSAWKMWQQCFAQGLAERSWNNAWSGIFKWTEIFLNSLVSSLKRPAIVATNDSANCSISAFLLHSQRISISFLCVCVKSGHGQNKMAADVRGCCRECNKRAVLIESQPCSGAPLKRHQSQTCWAFCIALAIRKLHGPHSLPRRRAKDLHWT